MNPTAPATDLERRKHVRLRLRGDLNVTPQRYEGKTYYVVKDPVSLRYYRFKEQEYFLLQVMDGRHTLDEAQKAFEKRFRPERLTLEDLEQFGQQLLQAGLVQNESPQAGKLLFQHRKKRLRMEWMQTLTNILYIKLPIFDPEKLLGAMIPSLRWIFTFWFGLASLAFMLAAVTLVLTHFDTFYARLPSYHEFFNVKTVVYLWFALGVVKVIHEFGHGVSCKAFGGEVHEMGFLFLCFSPAMYCNVSDAWTLPSKWQRIIISFAGIYVELMIAAAATFVWWNTPGYPFVNHMALSVMVVCSVSTVAFNGNPLMRYDGYYVLADWLEIPNLRDRANRYLQNLAMEYGLGIEVVPEPYMDLNRRILFVTYAVVSYVYRWVITFVIVKMISTMLKPYKLEAISNLMAVAALASMLGWPLYRLLKNVHKRGRLPDMKTARVTISACLVAGVLAVIFFVPMPVTRVRETGLVQVHPLDVEPVHVTVPGQLEKVHVQEGQFVRKGRVLATFSSLELDSRRDQAATQMKIKGDLVRHHERQAAAATDPRDKARLLQLRLTAERDFNQARAALHQVELEAEKLTLRAPADGVVLGLPKVDDLGKRWDKNEETLFCTVGSVTRLRVLVPVTPSDFDLIKENGGGSELRPLTATVRVQGLVERLWTGKVATPLPHSEAKEVPVALTSKAGGPLAVKPGGDPRHPAPQGQYFLVGIDIDQPGDTIAVGSLAQVKVHCEYRSIAWWAWRTIASVFDVRLSL